MKKLLISCTVLFLGVMLFAQPQKAALAQRIKENLGWQAGTAFENLVTLNLSSTLWDAVMDKSKSPEGQDQFYRMGAALVESHDFLFDSKLAERCNSYPTEAAKTDCEKDIIADKNKLNVTINATAIKYTEISYRLLFGYSSVVRDFLGNGSNNYGFNRGWRPKNKELHIIVELSDKVKDITVSWSADGNTGSVIGPAYTEVNEWDDKINKGLERGGKRIQ